MNMINASRGEDGTVTDELIVLQRSLVRRVVSSSTFAKSERLSTFLSCVCEMTLNGEAGQINEQKIGTSVFNRKPDYDSTVDGIVRTQASRLRQRLELYFSSEGADEPIRIVLPRGGYVPHFESRLPEPKLPEPRLPDTSAQPDEELAIVEVHTDAYLNEQRNTFPLGAPVTPSAARWFRILPWLLCGVLAISLVSNVLLHRGTKAAFASRQMSNDHPIWRRLFMESRPTLLVPADSGLVLFEGLSKQSTGLDDYIRGSYRGASKNPADIMQAIQVDAANRRYTSIVDLEMAASLARIANDRGTSLNIRYARDLRPNDLKSGNAVLSGAAQANPWVRLFEQQMNFVMESDPQSSVFYINNRSPLPGEPKQWASASDDPQHRVFGIVALLPNLTGDGDVLILEGTSMSGTEAAWDFVADDSKLLPFLKTIRTHDGSVPHFEVLVGTNNMGSSSVATSVYAWRVCK
jgi:hypothetical protein